MQFWYNDKNTWIEWESLACPRISSKAGSDTKKKRGKIKRFCSKYLEKTNINWFFPVKKKNNIME